MTQNNTKMLNNLIIINAMIFFLTFVVMAFASFFMVIDGTLTNLYLLIMGLVFAVMIMSIVYIERTKDKEGVKE